MLDHQDATNVDKKGLPLTVRTVFVIDPKKVIRLTLTYPAATGRNFDEIIRAVDCTFRVSLFRMHDTDTVLIALQLTDKHKVTTPVNWKPGEDVVIHATVSQDDAKKLFPEHEVFRPYLRTTKAPA